MKRRCELIRKLKTAFIFVAVFIIFFIIFAKSNKTKKVKLIKKISSVENAVAKIEKIKINEKNLIGKIKGMEIYKDRYYELDKSYYKINVFNKKWEFLYDFSRAGQGPGEIYNPLGFYIYDNRVFVFNSPGRIEIYKTEGKFIKTVKLEINRKNVADSLCEDFAVFNNKIYVYYNLGKAKVKVYDLEGKYLKTLIKRENSKVQIKAGMSNISYFRNIYIIPHLNYIVLSSKLDGSAEIYDLKTGVKILKYSSYDKIVASKVQKLKDSVKNRKTKSNIIETMVFSFFSISFNPYSDTIWNLKRKKDKKGYICYIIDLKTKQIKKLVFKINSDINILKFFFTCKTENYFIDDNYDIYKIKFGRI